MGDLYMNHSGARACAPDVSEVSIPPTSLTVLAPEEKMICVS